jgi:PAS domain S-box-containing protein
MKPTKPEPDNVPNGAPHGAAEPTHANGPPGGDDRWLRWVVHNTSEVVTIVDLDGTLRYASPAFERVLGYDPEQVVGTMNVLDHVHLDDLPHVLEETEKAVSEGGIVTNRAEYRFRHRDGSWCWMESSGTYLLDDPAVGGVVVASRDVTARKEDEEALRRSEAEIFEVLESITDAFFALDREWRFTYVNTQAGVLFSNNREDLIGERIWEDPTFYPEYRKAVAEGITARFEAYYPPLGAWYSVRAYPSESGLSVYLQDITERKRAETALRESEQRFRSSFRDAAIGMALVATDGRWLQVNRSLCEIVGYPKEELLTKTFQEITHPDDLDADVEQVRRMLAGEIETYQMEKRYIHKEGHVVWILLSVSLVHDEDGKPSTTSGWATLPWLTSSGCLRTPSRWKSRSSRGSVRT